MKLKITKRVVDGLKPGNSDLWVHDLEVEGFGVRVKPSGSKAYFLRYRVDGNRRLKTIGKHGVPWTPDTARKEARRLLGIVATGIDPKAKDDEAKMDLTTDQLCDRYFNAADSNQIFTKKGLPKKASTIAFDKGLIDAHVRPLIGRKKIKSISRQDIKKMRDDITRGKTAADRKTKERGRSIVRGGAASASRTLGVLSGIFTYAEKEDLVAANPVRGVERKTSEPRLRSISPSEYRAIGQALDILQLQAVKDEKSGTQIALAAIRAIFLTGCRRNEILELRKTEVDEFNNCLRFTDTKTNGQVRAIGDAAVAYIVQQDWDEKSPFVFPATRGDGHSNGVAKVWREVRELAELADITLHTARYGFASVSAEIGYSELIIAGLLGHTSGSVTRRYIHLVDPALITAANQVSSIIESRIFGAEIDACKMRVTTTNQT